MDISPRYLFLIVLAALNLFLALVVLVKQKGQKANIIFATLLFFVVLWLIGLILFGLSQDIQILTIAAHLFYASASVIPIGLFYFSLTFPARTIRFNLVRETFIFVVLGILLYISLTPKLLVTLIQINDWGNEVILGKSYIIYTLLHLLITSLAFFNFFLQYKKSKSIVRTQFRYVLFGIGIAYVFGALFNLILPLFGNYKLIWVGPYFLILMAISFTYAIIKHHLLNIRVIATELLIGLAVIVLFIDLITATSFQTLLLKGGILVVFIYLGWSLLQSVFKEIQRREELKKAYDALQELNRAKSEFISIASHQLRTPLTAIKGYISLALEGTYGKLDRKVRRPLSNVYESNERLIRLVNDLLSISRIESGKMKVELERTDIQNTIESVLEELEIKAHEKKLKLVLQKPEDTLPKIFLDQEKIRNVISNIIDNAIRYTDKGSITVRIYQQPESQTLLIKISDTGAGMTQQEISKLFESFSRGTTGTKRWTEGAGLGLYIAKQFVHMHKGKIWAESEGKDKGSTFFIELPMQEQLIQ
ncbi:hypothetical protein IID24_01995 [Patescibacteria group bacterium]|nr:hypothetical protein [Patescibacteria group bacterium]